MVKNILVVDDHAFGRGDLRRDPAAVDGLLGPAEAGCDWAWATANAFDLLLVEQRATDASAGHTARTRSPE